MADMCISLPDDLLRFLETQVATGLYRDETDYIRMLIASARSGHERLDALLVEGLESGAPSEATAEDWSELRKTVHHSLANG
jgi:putative addiction module CopG family antidote